MTSRHRIARIAVVLGCFSIPGLSTASGPAVQTSAGSFKPVFEPAPCPIPASAEVLAQVRCGYVRVPENAAKPEGRQLRLAVAIVKSLSSTPQPDPIVHLTGGPTFGAIATATAGTAGPRWAALRAERDIILHDYRGSGYSEPDFCPALDDELMQLYLSPEPPAGRRTKRLAALSTCLEQLRNQGIDLSQYSAATFATDLEYVRQALGYQRWNLRGGSFNTVVAREAMRRYPKTIRSVVLDSPPAPGPPTEILTDVLDRVWARCAADASCTAAFPDIGKSFWAAMDTLARDPIVMGPAESGPLAKPTGGAPALDQQRFVEAIFSVMYRRQLLPLVPMMVHQISTRTPGLLGMMGKVLLTTRGSRDGRPALTTVVHCASVNTWAADQKPTRELEVQEFATGFPASCETVSRFLTPGGLQPLTSDIPTLIFTGEFDPIVPRSGGPVVARTLSRSQLVEVPEGGHSESMADECTRGLASTFIASPERKLDTSCLATLPPLRFATDMKTAMQALGAK